MLGRLSQTERRDTMLDVKLNPDTGCSEHVCPTPDKGCGVCGAWYSKDVMSDIMLMLFKDHYDKVYHAEGNTVRFTRKDKYYKVTYFGGHYIVFERKTPVEFNCVLSTSDVNAIRNFMEV